LAENASKTNHGQDGEMNYLLMGQHWLLPPNGCWTAPSLLALMPKCGSLFYGLPRHRANEPMKATRIERCQCEAREACPAGQLQHFWPNQKHDNQERTKEQCS